MWIKGYLLNPTGSKVCAGQGQGAYLDTDGGVLAIVNGQEPAHFVALSALVNQKFVPCSEDFIKKVIEECKEVEAPGEPPKEEGPKKEEKKPKKKKD
jgi:hypothetical protein